jgi:hypothetical protein
MSGPSNSIVAELAGMRARAAELRDTLWAAHDGAELMDTVAEIEALKSGLDAMELEVVRELEATGAVKDRGWASTQDFLTHTIGGHKGTGPATVRLATATAEPALAPLAEAMADGWLSTTKAHVIERAIDRLPGDPALRARGTQVLLADAKQLDASALKQVALHLAAVVDPEGEARRDERHLDRLERAAHHSRHLSITDDQAGGAWIKGRCSTEDAALIKASLIPLAAPQPSDDGREPDPRDHGARMLDALVEACRLLQSTDVLPECHGAVPRLTLTMEYTQLHELTGFATTETGELLSASAVRRLCCDAEIIPAVLGAESHVLDVGRQLRLATAAIWRALVVRDRHCRFPRCSRPPMMCHAHHLTHWVDGGHTSLSNLLLLCGHHHRLVHSGPWHIRATAPGQFDFVAPDAVPRQTTTRAPPRE